MTDSLNIPSTAVEFLYDDLLIQRLDELTGLAADHHHSIAIETIGVSRGGRNLSAITLGTGPCPVGITAGAHADEPTGPMAALALIRYLLSAPEAEGLLQQHTFRICPQINPDGAAANAPWFRLPLDPLLYFRHVVRELPGDDVEFGYPHPEHIHDEPDIRPANRAVAAFLARANNYSFHASLHSMATAEGAWFLIGREFIASTAPLRKVLANHAARLGFPLHDMERHGDKGFTRIEPGFCTTPRSDAMREHFLARGDAQTADLFKLNSMEFVQRLGGNPLVMVSEMPLFLIDAASPPAPGGTAYNHLREELPAAVAALRSGDEASARKLIARYNVRTVDLRAHVELQVRMVIEALRFLSTARATAAD